MTDQPGNARSAGSAGFEPFAAFLRGAAEAQMEAVRLAQRWSTETMETYQEQAKEYHAMLEAVNRSLRAMEELMESQTKATQALRESVDAARNLVDTAAASNRKGLERMESHVSGMVEQVDRQLQALRQQAQLGDSLTTGPLAAQNAAYAQLTRDWMEAFSGLLTGRTAQQQDDPGTDEGR